MPLTSVAEIRLFFEEIQNVIRELIFLCTWGTEYETLRSLTAWFVDKTKFNELIEQTDRKPQWLMRLATRRPA